MQPAPDWGLPELGKARGVLGCGGWARIAPGPVDRQTEPAPRCLRLRIPKAGRPPSPHAQVGAAGVVAAGREHPAGVGADVPGPGLRDVQGAVPVQAEAGVALRAQRDAVFLPDVPERGEPLRAETQARGAGAAGSWGGGVQPKAGLQPGAPEPGWGEPQARAGHPPSHLRRGWGGGGGAGSGSTSSHPAFTPSVQVQVPAWLLLTRSHRQAAQSGHKLFSQRG